MLNSIADAVDPLFSVEFLFDDLLEKQSEENPGAPRHVIAVMSSREQSLSLARTCA